GPISRVWAAGPAGVSATLVDALAPLAEGSNRLGVVLQRRDDAEVRGDHVVVRAQIDALGRADEALDHRDLYRGSGRDLLREVVGPLEDDRVVMDLVDEPEP